MQEQELFEQLYAALRANMVPETLAGFLPFVRAKLAAEFDAAAVVQVPTPAPAAPGISADSETPAVAAWCQAQGLNASVVGAWVWCDPYQQPGLDRSTVDALLAGTGFRFSARRQSYFHACTVSCRRQPGDKRRGGKLERFHGTASVADYNPKTFDPRPGWQLAKAAKAKARRRKS